VRKIKHCLINASAIILIGFTTTASASHDKHINSADSHHQQVAADDKQLIRDTINSIYDTP
jgi:deoxyhypusine synthase